MTAVRLLASREVFDAEQENRILSAFKEDVPPGFDNPTAAPQDEQQNRNWQEFNRGWWESHPMRYDWKQKIVHEEFSRGFYEEIDQRFFADAAEYLPWKKIPFDALVDFPSLQNKDVLEIGVGSGSHAGLLAAHARSFTGIDITDYAVKSTTSRLAAFGLRGDVRRVDAEKLEFADNSFDFVWSWGVIHHSANTRQILREIHRVLRPGGKATTMVYCRNWYNYYFVSGFCLGVVRGELFRGRSLHEIQQRWTDGGMARYYSVAEWKRELSDFSRIESVRIVGSKAQLVPLPGGRFKSVVMSAVPNAVSRLFTNTLGLGNFLVSTVVK
jgi:2-polyprenyl-3-methyl-5-hydroxy-6-metoxy-1,4-benzoquinol methylase